ncbi:hypothetical protein IAQ61_005344 [Plenodomus lingam]|uniref:uncharacterized protein n=1 Tax=Leptosphaeria maculans TaxID=5022 RepID=UPI0033250FC4|nr:hypothetical protein IAQ61_005344 [Plenodomus lingam]
MLVWVHPCPACRAHPVGCPRSTVQAWLAAGGWRLAAGCWLLAAGWMESGYSTEQNRTEQVNSTPSTPQPSVVSFTFTTMQCHTPSLSSQTQSRHHPTNTTTWQTSTQPSQHETPTHNFTSHTQ